MRSHFAAVSDLSSTPSKTRTADQNRLVFISDWQKLIMGAQPKLKPFCQSFVFFPFPFDLLFPFPLASANVTMQRATLWRRFPWQPPKHRSFSRVPTFASELLHWYLVPLHSAKPSPRSLLSGIDIQSGKPTAQVSVHPYPCLRAQEKNGGLITTYARWQAWIFFSAFHCWGYKALLPDERRASLLIYSVLCL